ncbi:Hypothetical protein NTJ_04487 [Nesidiocoris tenuis]|uniref:Uncharacterized protein n=1 Tax=Nesidiocoris tenuis TaxID=355587 RepID=A0ABN7AKF8_9HEMI|nr:Hypothetical protein NTJ_04487 [Nesidiocoris tenuis]
MFPITHLETCLIDQITDRDKGLLKGRLVAHEELLKNPDQMEMLDQPVNGKTSDHRKPEASISSERQE